MWHICVFKDLNLSMLCSASSPNSIWMLCKGFYCFIAVQGFLLLFGRVMDERVSSKDLCQRG